MRLPSRFNGYSADGSRQYFKGGVGSSTTTTSIPSELKPLASAYAAKAMDLSNQGYTPYNGQRFADLNGYQTAGADAIANRAMNGSSEINAGSDMLTNTLNGGYLNNNQYLDSAYDAAAKSVTKNYNSATNNTDSLFARSGAFGGSAWEQAQKDNKDVLANNLSDLSNQMYYGNYANERQNQLNASGQALNYGNQAYTDAGQMIKAGQMYQDQDQQNKDFAYQQYQEAQNQPYKDLAAMAGVFGSNPYGMSQTTKQSGGGK